MPAPETCPTHINSDCAAIRGSANREAQSILDNIHTEKTLVTIAHCGHEGAYPRNPGIWTAAVSSFIGRVVTYPPGEIRR